MRILCLIVSTLLCAACASNSQLSDSSTADRALENLYEREWAWRQQEMALQRNAAGGWVRSATLPDVSAVAQQRRLAYWEEALAELGRIENTGLSRQASINAAVFRQIIETNADRARFRTYEAPLNSDTFFWTGLHPRLGGFSDYDSYQRYLGRLQDIPRFFDQHIDNMRLGLSRGYSVPAVSLQGRDQSIESYLQSGEENPFWIPLHNFPPNLSEEQQSRLREQALEVLERSVVPAYRDLLVFIREEYLPNTRRSISARDLPDGEAFYLAQIREYTTLELSPEDIHQRGLREVGRIRAEMRLILEEVNFDGDMAAFFDFLRNDPQFYAKTPDELMGYSSYVAKRMDGKLSEVLGFLPRRRFAIIPVPPAIAPVYTGGRGGLNACQMNTYNLPARPLYTLPALTLHECAPGHALQAAIALEAPGAIPEFRAQNYFSGYGEGWGLYTEWLGGQIGIYRTPYERFGQLTYEMWRACRLVIDTGLHHYGWSRDKALAYLRDNAALSEHEITTEIDRYISWPGQALSYKLGEMLLREKRARAEAVLGERFDQRYFHDVILGLRSVPLTVLGEELDAWIDAGGLNPYPSA